MLFTQLKEKEDVSISIWLKKEEKYTIKVEVEEFMGPLLVKLDSSVLYSK